MGKIMNSVFQGFKERKSTGQVQLPQQKKPKRKTIIKDADRYMKTDIR
jgi:hypothetical protein